jgi:hypothetical protein
VTVSVRLERDGEVCQLKQPVSSTGIPLCVYCQKRIPKSYRKWRDEYGRRTLFCTNTCAQKWAEWAAEQIYPVVKEAKIAAEVVGGL